MDLAQLDSCNNKWKVSLIVIILLFFVTVTTVLLRILTMLSLPKPTKVDDRRFTLADWTMIAAFVGALRSEGYFPYLMN